MPGYPGQEMQMSNYGFKDRSPQEAELHWKEYCAKEIRLNKHHLATKGNGTSVWPGIKEATAEEKKHPPTFFSDAKKESVSDYTDHMNYERMFHVDEGYNSKLHRDDRQHTVGLDMHKEEGKRMVPVRSSTEYGRRVEQPLEKSSRQYARVDRVVKGFYRCRGTGIPTTMD